MTHEEIELKKAELEQDIQFVDRNLMGISSLIVKEIGALERMKNGINLYKLDGIKIDRKNNCAQIVDLETFERQLTREVSEVIDAISMKRDFIKHLTSEQTRIQQVKNGLVEKHQALSTATPAKTETQKTSATSTGTQLNFDFNTKK